jgi:hypothetical protein
MKNNRYQKFLTGFLTIGMLLVASACNRGGGNQEVKDLAQKAAEVDTLNQQATAASADESKKLAAAGVTNVAPDPATLQLTDAQRASLENRIKAEKNSSYQALLQEGLDKDQEIKTLNTRIAQLRAVLPKPVIAQADDSHYGLAMRFLRRKGVPEEKAKLLIAKVLIMDKLAPGFEVYNYYANGVYGTWVAQGKAEMSPTQLQSDQRAALETERDTANQKSVQLQADLDDLNAQKERLTADIDQLRTEKTRMTDDLAKLAATNEAQTASLNSVHYRVGTRKDLVEQGIIVVPVFSKDRAGSHWEDGVFTQSADLRSEDSITLTAAEAGLQKIGKVNVIPGSLEKHKKYTLAISQDRTTATVKFLNKERFRNEKVVFALAD